MKILRLRLTNLNSLRGDNSVDFTQPPLAHAGLFAITGPTGAGKSTLLDAITLALYGRVARYGSVPSPDAVMSRHTGECSAEVDFVCAAGEFRSVWQLQRARRKADGKVQPAKRRVIELPGEKIIAESIKDADAKILQLTGLDYDRFLRSVLLAQGDFAAFLKAGARERTDLLQQVTGTFVYQDISQAAFRRAADAEQALTQLRLEQAAVTVLPPEQRTQHEADLAAQNRLLQELQTLVPTLGRRIDAARRWLELERAARQLQTDQAAFALAEQEAVPALARLVRHEAAAPFIADLTRLDHLAAEDARDTRARQDLDTDAPQLLRNFQSARTAAQQASEALTRETERVAGLRLLWADVTALDQSLATAREALRQREEQHREAMVRLTTTTGACTAAEATLQRTAAEHQAAMAWLDQHQIDATLVAQLPEIQAAHARWLAAADAGAEADQTLQLRRTELARVQTAVGQREQAVAPLHAALTAANTAVTAALAAVEVAGGRQPPAELESRRDRAREHRQALENLAAEAGRIRTQQAELAAVRREADATTEALQRAVAEGTQRAKEHGTATALLEARRTAVLFAEKVQSLESHRAALRPDEPCPLCGGRHHPYVQATDTPAGGLAALRGQVAAAEAAAREAQEQLRAAETRQARHEADAKRLAAAVEKLGADGARLAANWNLAAGPHGLDGQWDDTPRLTAAITSAREEEGRRDAQLVAVRNAEANLAAARRIAQAAEAAFGQADTERQKESALLLHLQAQLPVLETARAGHHTKVAEARVAFAQLTTSHLPTAPDAAPATGLVERLKARAETYTRHRKAADDLHAAIGTQRATFEACAQQRDQAAAQVAAGATKVAEARADVAERDRRRQEKFGGRAVADAQREAEAALQLLRDAADAKRRELDTSRRKQESAAQEHTRLTAVIAARSGQRAPIVQRLQTDAAAAGFGDESALRAALLDATEAATLVARRAGLEDRRTVLKTQAEGIVVQRAQLPPAAAEDAVELTALETEKSVRDAGLTAAHAAVAEVRAILKQDDGVRQRHAAVAERILAADREFSRWEQLRRLIGSADGSLFARFAQGLTLEHLTILANGHLRDLNPRYSIRRARDGETGDLELEIIDHYQADVARPMRSLSGGESFLVSLALALGLSKLASGRTSIESLFIDEGFGSLDADTLEVAMSALENLQAGGKIIGVISHVPAMQERIAVQINVSKESGGCSRITLRS